MICYSRNTRNLKRQIRNILCWINKWLFRKTNPNEVILINFLLQFNLFARRTFCVGQSTLWFKTVTKHKNFEHHLLKVKSSFKICCHCVTKRKILLHGIGICLLNFINIVKHNSLFVSRNRQTFCVLKKLVTLCKQGCNPVVQERAEVRSSWWFISLDRCWCSESKSMGCLY